VAVRSQMGSAVKSTNISSSSITNSSPNDHSISPDNTSTNQTNECCHQLIASFTWSHDQRKDDSTTGNVLLEDVNDEENIGTSTWSEDQQNDNSTISNINEVNDESAMSVNNMIQ
jgi:hypothetical protein